MMSAPDTGHLPAYLATPVDLILSGVSFGWTELADNLGRDTPADRATWAPVVASTLRIGLRELCARIRLDLPAELLAAEAPESPEWVPFPVDALPEPLASYVAQAAPACGADPSMIALPLLSLLASCIGTTRRIRLKKGWEEPAALWCVYLARSGQKKSPSFNEVMGLLAGHVERAAKRYANDVAHYKRETALRKGHKASPDDEPLEEPRQHLYMVKDITREAMIARLRDNPRGLLLARDELAGWFQSFGAYKNGKGGGGDVESWLELYTGGPQIIDRRGGALEDRHIHVARALVSVAGSIQPETLRRIVSKESIDNGLLARFMLASPPEQVSKWSTDEVNPACRRAVSDVVDWLLALCADADGAPVDMRLSSDALERWVEWVNDIGSRIAGTDVDSLKAAYAKAEGAAARIALVMHLSRCGSGDGADTQVVDRASIESGIRIAGWFLAEAMRVYEEMGWSHSRTKDLEERVASLLRSAPPVGLTMTEIHRSLGNHSSSSALRRTLDALSQRGMARSERDTPTPQHPRAPERWFPVHADLH